MTYTDKNTAQRVQRALGISADGIIGPQTRAAVSAFNSAHGIASGTDISDQTLAAIAASGNTAAALSAPASGGATQGAAVVAPPLLDSDTLVAGLPLWKVLLGGAGVAFLTAGIVTWRKK